MNLYLLTQTANQDHDTYDSVIVCAETPTEAKKIHPNKLARRYGDKILSKYKEDDENGTPGYERGSWAFIEEIKCKLIGEAHKNLKKGVVLASYRAG
jgi:hypothetical protein